ncbi:unnamed protein product, partial [Allacma fusca]
PQDYNFDNPLSDEDLEYIFKKFKKVFKTNLDVIIDDNDYPEFVSYLKRFIYLHSPAGKADAAESEQQPQLRNIATGDLTVAEEFQSLLEEPSEFHSFTADDISQPSEGAKDLLRETELHRQLLDSGRGSSVRDTYLFVDQDSNPITSGSSSDAETLADTEESETGSPQ